MLNFTKKKQIPILVLIGILSIFIMKYVLDDKEEGYEDFSIEEQIVEVNDEANGYKDNSAFDNEIIVHIKGAVNKPGIVKAEEGDRIVDIIALADGLKENADTERVNLALKVKDELMIKIPFIGEVDDDTNKSTSDIQDNVTAEESLININTAEKEELKKLSGVGDSTAEKIIQHREETKFEEIQDIMNVSGIGEKKYEAIKDLITVN